MPYKQRLEKTQLLPFSLYHEKQTISFSSTKLLTTTTIVIITLTLCPALKIPLRPDKYPEMRYIPQS